jgi:hypothetical protein
LISKFLNKTSRVTKTAIVMSSIAISIIFVAGLAGFPLIEKAMANPCSDIASSGGNGGSGTGTGNTGSESGLGNIIGNLGLGIGGPGGDGQSSVDCTFEDVQISEP